VVADECFQLAEQIGGPLCVFGVSPLLPQFCEHDAAIGAWARSPYQTDYRHSGIVVLEYAREGDDQAKITLARKRQAKCGHSSIVSGQQTFGHQEANPSSIRARQFDSPADAAMVVHQASFGMAESPFPLAHNFRPVRSGIFIVPGWVADYQVIPSGTKVRLGSWIFVYLASLRSALIKGVVQKHLEVLGVPRVQKG